MTSREDEIKRLVAERNRTMDYTAMVSSYLVALEGREMSALKYLVQETIDRSFDLLGHLTQDIHRLKNPLSEQLGRQAEDQLRKETK